MSGEDTGIWRAAVDQRLGEGAKRMAALTEQGERHDRGQLETLRVLEQMRAEAAKDRKELAANTEITQQIRDMWKAGTWGHKVIVWVGGLCMGLGGIVGLYTALRALFRE